MDANGIIPTLVSKFKAQQKKLSGIVLAILFFVTTICDLSFIATVSLLH